MKHKISIVITTYNRKKLLSRAINSVLSQNYHNIEIVIMDNDSCDGTDEYVKSLKDKRIVYIKNEYNIGAGKNKRKSLEFIHGDYVSFLDDDDYYVRNDLFTNIIDAFVNKKANSVVFDSYICGKTESINIERKVGFSGLISGVEYSNKIGKEYSKPSSTFTTFQKKDNLGYLYDLIELDDAIIFTCALYNDCIYSLGLNYGIYSCSGIIDYYNVSYSFFDINFNGLYYMQSQDINKNNIFKNWFRIEYIYIASILGRSMNIKFKDIIMCIIKIIKSKTYSRFSQVIHLLYNYCYVRIKTKLYLQLKYNQHKKDYFI